MRLLIVDSDPLEARELQQMCIQWSHLDTHGESCEALSMTTWPQAESCLQAGGADILLCEVPQGDIGDQPGRDWLREGPGRGLVKLMLLHGGEAELQCAVQSGAAGTVRCPPEQAELFHTLYSAQRLAQYQAEQNRLTGQGSLWLKSITPMKALLYRELLGLPGAPLPHLVAESPLMRDLGFDPDTPCTLVLFCAYDTDGDALALTDVQRSMIASGLLFELIGRDLVADGTRVYAVCSGLEAPVVRARCEQLQQRFGPGVHICCFFGRPAYWEKLPESRRALEQAARDCIRLEPRVNGPDDAPPAALSLPALPAEWKTLLAQGHYARFGEALSAWLDSGAAPVRSAAALRQLSLDLWQLLAAHLQQKQTPLHALACLPDALPANLPQLKSICRRVLAELSALRVSGAVTDERGLLVRRVLAYIGENLDTPLERDTIARQINLSSNYLARIFREETGKTLSDTIQEMRVRRAAELILQSDRGISEIAQECGYANFSYFSLQFRRLMGCAPREYRRQAGHAGSDSLTAV